MLSIANSSDGNNNYIQYLMMSHSLILPVVLESTALLNTQANRVSTIPAVGMGLPSLLLVTISVISFPITNCIVCECPFPRTSYVECIVHI